MSNDSAGGTKRIKNKSVAPLQISAEQILLEAFERRETPLKKKNRKFTDLDELQDFQARKRKEFEDALTRKRQDILQWQRYAQFELDQKEYDRARSIFERALDVDPTNVALWIRYIQSELKERNVNHARNLLDRAVTMLPRVEKLWFTYVSVEEMLSNFAGCRQVFERWMAWKPEASAWLAYINMEKRYKEYDRAREIFTRFTSVHPAADNWIKWAKFEEEFGSVDNVRQVFENAVEVAMQFGVEQVDEKVIVQWTKWETRQKEYERARSIYKLFLQQLPSKRARNLYNEYTKFEKQCGDKDGIEDVILSKRCKNYEATLASDPKDYDTWFSYLQLMEETSSSMNDIRDLFERAISNVPEDGAKKGWKRYIFLWIRYAVYEELSGHADRARQVYEQCVGVIPHKRFTFAKIWLLYAKFEIRQGNVTRARKLLGKGLGMSQKPKIYRGYIELEMKLKEFDRCRKLYEKYLENHPEMAQVWIDFATLEQNLGDDDRARAIYQMAIQQPEMDMPELVWKRFIEFETDEGQYQNARDLYEQLVQDSPTQVKVWISFAMFEVAIPPAEQNEDENENEEEGEGDEFVPDEEAIAHGRQVFDRAWKEMKRQSLIDERVVLLDAWEQYEEQFGNESDMSKVAKMKPSLVRKRRRLDDGTLEEYETYAFPEDDEGPKGISKILANARKWKQSTSTST